MILCYILYCVQVCIVIYSKPLFNSLRVTVISTPPPRDVKSPSTGAYRRCHFALRVVPYYSPSPYPRSLRVTASPAARLSPFSYPHQSYYILSSRPSSSLSRPIHLEHFSHSVTRTHTYIYIFYDVYLSSLDPFFRTRQAISLHHRHNILWTCRRTALLINAVRITFECDAYGIKADVDKSHQK